MDRGVLVWLILNATLTSYLAFKNYSQVSPLSEDDQIAYDDL